MNDYYYNKKTGTLYVYKKITVKELLHLKQIYPHVEVREEERKKRW